MPTKLIEVALPLAEVDDAARRESQGRISPLHLWWSRKPGAAVRAVVLAALLDDPGDAGRTALLRLVARVAQGEAGALDEARAHLAGAPPVFDPFCGGGAIAAEAARLGLPTVSGDLNPVAVLATRALIDYPARFRDIPPTSASPVHVAQQLTIAPELGPASAPTASSSRARVPGHPGAFGLVADLRHYGEEIAAVAERSIGAAYPPAPGGEPVLAWIWARTSPCPHCGASMLLTHSFDLSTRPRRRFWVSPGGEVNGPAPPAGTVAHARARCLHCGALNPLKSIRAQGFTAPRLLAAVTAGRRYLPPTPEQEAAAAAASPPWVPPTELAKRALGWSIQAYGLRRHHELYTPRQLLALATFADLVREAGPRIEAAAVATGLADDGIGLADGGRGARAYAQAVQTYLGLALSRCAARWSTFARWQRARENVEHAFGRPGLAMTWDFAEANPFVPRAGGWLYAVETVASALEAAPREGPAGTCRAADAAVADAAPRSALVCTDPPYFDTLPYADMADLFYIWLKPALAAVHPDLFAGELTPKSEEIVAEAYRFGGAAAARGAFVRRLGQALTHCGAASGRDLPVVIFFGFKGTAGWEALIEALVAAGLRVVAAWPLRTQHDERLRSLGSDAAAGSVVLACRPREAGGGEAQWAEVAGAMRAELGQALGRLVAAAIPPADLGQAAIGAGMAAFTRQPQVMDGHQPVSVQQALQAVQEAVDQHLLAAGDPRALAYYQYRVAVRAGRSHEAQAHAQRIHDGGP